MAEFSAVRDRQTAGDVLSFDDYTADTYAGVVRAADEICRRHGYGLRSARPRRSAPGKNG